MILPEILRRTEQRVAKLPAAPADPVFAETSASRCTTLSHAIRAARNGTIAVIAEIKCASPSRGTIRRNVDTAMMAGDLVQGGCIGLSVVTEPYFFGGSVRDIPLVKAAVNIPVLRKDFIIDERQLAETCALVADAVLLIAAVLKERLPSFVDAAYRYGIEPLVEVHTKEEVHAACATRARLIGINNRNLATMTVDRSTTRLLSDTIRLSGRTIVSESGMRNAEDVRELRSYCDAFLIGSAIMADRHPRKKLEEFVCA